MAWSEEGLVVALARISHTLAAHLANHLAASGFVLPHHIALDMPWSSSPPGDQSITQSEPPECEISGLEVGKWCRLMSKSAQEDDRAVTKRYGAIFLGANFGARQFTRRRQPFHIQLNSYRCEFLPAPSWIWPLSCVALRADLDWVSLEGIFACHCSRKGRSRAIKSSVRFFCPSSVRWYSES